MKELAVRAATDPAAMQRYKELASSLQKQVGLTAK
jgi:hypothetical protein